jgi:hypothetical protein
VVSLWLPSRCTWRPPKRARSLVRRPRRHRCRFSPAP